MPDWETVPSDDFSYARWLYNMNNYESDMKALEDLDDGTAEECGYDFIDLSDEEAETLWDFETL